ncbi:MAG: hypothetical protein ACRD3D_16820 [Terriglobia bacterium]
MTEVLRAPGVYLLYRDRDIIYVGKASRVFDRVLDHAEKRYVLWNHFSAFLVREEHVDNVEAIVIAATNSEANRSSAKTIDRVALPPEVLDILRRNRKIDPEA